MYACGKEKSQVSADNIMGEAELITITEKNNYDEIIITNRKGERVGHYILSDKDSISPTGIEEDAEIIKVPLTSAILDSEVYAGAFEELGADKAIRGMFDTDFVTSPTLKKAIDDGQIINAGSSSTPNLEKIAVSSPEVVFISYFDGMQTQAIDKIGIPVIKMFDLQESTPLGRAEWIRFIGRLVGKKVQADSIYSEVKNHYLAEKQLSGGANTISEKKKVLTETIYEGVWNVAGGKSYQACLIKDAGGKYFKEADATQMTLMLSPEVVLKDGADSDLWIIRYYGSGEELKRILDSDPIYKEIKALKDKNVYYSDTSTSGLFREFPFHPEKVLKDYRIIISGGPEEALTYFKPLFKK